MTVSVHHRVDDLEMLNSVACCINPVHHRVDDLEK